MWELDCEESWALKNWCFWTVVLEKTLESPLDWKEIQPVHPKGHQSWVFNGRTDAKAETPILWPPHVKSWVIGKDPDAGRDWEQEEKVMTEDEMAGWHHRLDAHGFGWTPGVSDGQGGLVCCDSWGGKESDMTERLKWTELNWTDDNWWPYTLGLLLVSEIAHTLWSVFLSNFLPLSTTNWHLPRAFVTYLYGGWILCCCSCWPLTHPKGSSGGEMEWALGAPGKLVELVFK